MVEKRVKKALKILSHIDASAISMQDLAIQVRASSLGELLEDAAKDYETILHVKDRELARMLWGRIGNADIAEAYLPIGEEFSYLVGLKKPDRPAANRGCCCL
jgi:hypothetical protein